MPITVFDAVGKFTADSRNLDEFITKLDRALPDASQRSAVATKALKDAQDNLKASLRALREEGGNTAENWQKVADAQRQVAITSAAAKRTHDDLNRSVGNVKHSTEEARGAAELLGRAFGIELPREVRKFLAEIPGFQKLLSGAFNVTVIYFFIQALGEGVLKIEEIIRALAGWTEEARKAYDEQVKLNQTFIDLDHAREEAAIRAKERGLEGAALTKQQITDNKEVLALIGARLSVLTPLQQTTQKQVETEESWGKAVDAWSKGSAYMEERRQKIESLRAALKTQQDEITGLIKERESILQAQGDKSSQLTHQELAEYIALEAAKTEAKRANTQQQTDLDLAAYRAQYQDGIITFAQLLDLEAQTQEKKFQIDEQAQQDKLNLLRLDPTRNIVAIATLNGQIEAAQKEHEAKLLSDYAKYQEEYKKLSSVKPESVQFTQDVPKVISGISTVEFSNSEGAVKKINDILNAIRQLKEAYHDLGVQSSQDLAQQAQKMGEDFEKIKNSGTASKRDLILAEAAYVEALIESEKAAGASTYEAEKRLAAIEKAASKLGVTLDRLGKNGTKSLASLFKQMISGSISAGAAMKVFGQITAEGIGQSVAAAVEGSESFGQAMERWLKSTLATLAGEAVVQAIVELAKGFAALSPTSPDFGHAGEHFTSAAIWGTVAAAAAGIGSQLHPGEGGGDQGAPEGTQPIETTPVSETQATPTKTTQVQRFAAGGLVTAPTMAIIGDSINGASAASAAALGGPGQQEAVIPIDDDRATSAIAQALLKHMPRERPIVNIHGKSLKHLIREISHEVEGGGVQLTASRARSVRKKS